MRRDGSFRRAPGSRRARGPVGSLALAACVAIAMASWSDAAPRSRKVVPRVDRHFGHAAHAVLEKARYGKNESCGGTCHALSADGQAWTTEWNDKSEHQRCFATCHSNVNPRKVSRSFLASPAARLCYPCHADRFRQVPAELGPIAGKGEPEHVVSYSHRRHAPVASRGTQCQACHGGGTSTLARQSGSLSGGHGYCSGCHQRGTEPFMSACASCHVPGGSTAATAAQATVKQPRAPTPYAVTGAFDHERHARDTSRAGGQAQACTDCHDNLAGAASDNVIPLPTMRGCYQRCHDGTHGFDALANTCTRCHRGGKP